MEITTSLIQKLRVSTSVGMMDAKKALEKNNGDFDKAIDYLKKQGRAVAAKKQNRTTKQGAVGYYLHSNGRVGAMVALACESDFVAKTDDFKNLAHELAMQIAATDPAYLSPDQVPSEVIVKEKEIFKASLEREKKPAKILDKIVEGKLQKFYAETCLLKQQYIKDDKFTVEQLIHQAVQKFGENIQIKEFRYLSL